MEKHWVRVFRSLLIDSFMFAGLFFLSLFVRHKEDAEVWERYLPTLWSGIVVGAVAVGCFLYVAGAYSPQHSQHRHPVRDALHAVLVVTACQALSLLVLIIQFYINFSTRIGRGTMLIAALLAWAALVLHHLYLRRTWGGMAERIAYVVTSPRSEAQGVLLAGLSPRFFTVAGVIRSPEYTLREDQQKELGTTADIVALAHKQRLHRVVFSPQDLDLPELRDTVCQLRYSGVSVISMMQLCEEVYQCAPVSLVTPQWLLSASDGPHVQYIRKIKRLIDIVASAVGLVVLSPVLLLGAVAVRLSSPGPVIFRQTRVGRFGKPFELLKLRTMRQDAERNGAEWSRTDDPRITPVGTFLRRYRIDEIPQLVNVLRGEMSFVGPRPERPEFVEMLCEEVPFFQERLMVHPGVTGWAQVNFPYGASVEDARRKLEYDLFYMKHMGFFLDMLIMLDTVRTVIRGSVWSHSRSDLTDLIRLAEGDKQLAVQD